MSSVSSLVRRGAEFALAQYLQDSDEKPVQPAGWKAALFMLSFIVLGLLSSAVEYTYGMVVATLAAVEDTHPDIYVRIDSDFDPNKPLNNNNNELEMGAAPPPKPITSKLRTTIKHLRARAGYWSRFRGLSMFNIYMVARGLLTVFIPVPSSSFLVQLVVQSLIGVLLATWQMAWVHIVISEPSSKRIWQRLPSVRFWRKIAPAAAFQEILTSAGFFIPMAIAKFAGWFEIAQDKPPMEAMCRFLAISIVPTLLALLISIPGRVVFIRVAASMLPEEDESIVPFDRSFGGKVTPAILGGSGKLSIPDAWSTFDWPARIRFATVIGKTLAIQVALGVLGGLLIGGQLLWMGSGKTQPQIVG